MYLAGIQTKGYATMRVLLMTFKYLFVRLQRLLQIVDLPVGILGQQLADLTLDVFNVTFDRLCRRLGRVELSRSVRRQTNHQKSTQDDRSRQRHGELDLRKSEQWADT